MAHACAAGCASRAQREEHALYRPRDVTALPSATPDINALAQIQKALAESSPPDDDSSSGHGGGGRKLDFLIPHTHHQLQPITAGSLSPAQISNSWTKTDSDTWLLRTKNLDRVPAQRGLRCADVPADDNCAYYAIAAAIGHQNYGNLKKQAE